MKNTLKLVLILFLTSIPLNGAYSQSSHSKKINQADSINKHPKRAVAFYSRYIKNNPKYPRAYLERGKAFLALDKNDLAMTDFNKALLLDPKLADVFIYRGTLFFEIGKKQRAIKDFERYANLKKNSACKADGYRNVAKVYYDMNEFEKAVFYLSKAISLDQNSANYWNRGYAYFKLKKYNMAVKDYTSAINQKDTDDITKYYSSRAKAYEKLGNKKLAQKDWDFVKNRVKDGWGAFLDMDKN